MSELVEDGDEIVAMRVKDLGDDGKFESTSGERSAASGWERGLDSTPCTCARA